MCGIVGAVSSRNIVPVLVEGLKRLEYRGYDSCGVAVYDALGPKRARSVSRVAELDQQVRETALSGFTGIAHTRWATHGAPATHNAHPHFSPSNEAARIALVHNGIIENHDALRVELIGKGYVFISQTDTEVIAHLIDSLYDGDLFDATRAALKRLQGAYSVAVFCSEEPHRIVGARDGSPLVLGCGADGGAGSSIAGECFLASDAMALAGVTNRIVYLEDGDAVDIQLGRYWITDRDDRPVTREARTVNAHSGAAELGPYRHYMQKEIFEQPRAIADTLEGLGSEAGAIGPHLFDQANDGAVAAAAFADIDSVLILACGTSYYSGLTAKYWLESIAKIPTQVEVASEYRYRDSVPNPKTLIVVISQSGETADTLAALKHAKALGHRHTLAICNVGTSAIVRLTELAYLTRAGAEVGVASTKAFTTQLCALFLLSLTLAKLRGHLTSEDEALQLKDLRHLPAALQSVLALEPQIIAWAEAFARKENALFLGRGLHYPIALEGALKLKEITYIHAEAYPAGELKHGPLALVTEAMPVVTVAPNDALLEKLKSNMQEVRARGGQLYVFADALLAIVKEAAVHPWIHPLGATAAHAGLRRSELVRVRKSDVDFDSMILTVRERKRTKGKRTTRRVPLSTSLAGVLREWLEGHPGGPFLFAQSEEVFRSNKRSHTTGHKNGEERPKSLKGRLVGVSDRERPGILPLTIHEVSDHFRRTVNTGPWSVVPGLHCLRHSFISACASKGLDQRIIDEFVGHSTEEQRRRYRHLYPSVQADAIKSVFG